MSNETKHTPGPYRAQNDVNTYKSGNSFGCPVWADNGPEGGKIAGEGIAPTREMAVANAVLFSAAPDLLAACKYVVKHCRENDSGDGELYGLDFVTDCIAAIAKAKGE